MGDRPIVEIASLIVSLVGVAISGFILYLVLYDRSPRIKIEHHRGRPPERWLNEARHATPTEPVMAFRVKNTGKPATITDIFVALANGAEDRSFTADFPPIPILLQSGIALVFWVDLRELSRNLVNKGCSGTCRAELVFLTGSYDDSFKASFEIPDVEAKAGFPRPAG